MSYEVIIEKQALREIGKLAKSGKKRIGITCTKYLKN